jgi:dienelactone hydrolase
LLVRELASHGYVVACLDHPSKSEMRSSGDGQVAASNWISFASEEAFEKSKRAVEHVLALQASRVQSLVEKLSALNCSNSGGRFAGRLALDRIGIIGFSFGGAVAAEVCRSGERFAAGVNMDGILFGASAAGGIPKPFLFFSSDGPVPTEAAAKPTTPDGRARKLVANDYRNVMNSLRCNGGYYLVLSGARHRSFCDPPIYKRLRGRAAADEIQPQLAIKIVAAYTLEFFKRNGIAFGAAKWDSSNFQPLAPKSLSQGETTIVNIHTFPHRHSNCSLLAMPNE